MLEQEIVSVIRAQERATARGDAQAMIDTIDNDVVAFDLQPPLAYCGQQARDVDGINAWLDTWSGGVVVHLADPHVILEKELAVVFGFSRMSGTKTDGTQVDSWSRRTLVLKRRESAWKIIHEHASFPMAMDGSNLAVTDLIP